MDYSIESSALETLQSDCMVIGIYQNQHLSPTAISIDNITHGLVSKIIQRDDIEGKNGDTLLINAVADSSIERILLVGLGEQQALSGKKFKKAADAAIKALMDTKISSAHCALVDCEVEDQDWQWKTRQIIEAFSDATYQVTQLKAKKDTPCKLEKLSIVASEENAAEAQAGLEQGQAIAQGVELSKLLADLPGNICTPSYLAEQAQTLDQQFDKLSVDILEEADMEKLGMGSFLAVSRGSRQPAKLITLNYQGADDNSKPIVLIGKGLTFDAGGISLKPGAGMDEMKYDMCGGASVLGAFKAAVSLNLPLNIIGLIPSSENMPDGDANKPGDVLTSMSGQTIEVLNTDAEGRLILCDTLTYAERFNPDVVIDMATLTGACIIALGRIPSGLMGNDDDLCNDLIAASETAHDSVWRLPIWEEYQEQLKSSFADMANIGGRDAGTITAACFLSRFAEKFRWAHIDIAGTAWRTGANKGATGRPVPLLVQYLINRANAGS